MNACEICWSTDLSQIKILTVYTHQKPIHICKNCGLVQVIDRRPPKRIYQAWVNAKPGDVVYKSAEAAVAARHAYVKAFVPKLSEERFVDIGGGDGKFAALFDDCTNWALMAEDLPDEQYAAATILWTLENCGSCRDVIDSAKRVLKPGGTLVVATGSRILAPYKKPLWSYVGPGDQDLHPWRFSANTLQRLLIDRGFSIVDLNHWIDSDYLVVVAKNTPSDEKTKDFVDPWRKVVTYFENWHSFTQEFYPCNGPQGTLSERKN